MADTTTNPRATPEYSQIVSSLNRIRSRLWMTRLTERVAIALGWAGVVAVFLVSARLLVDRWPFWAFVLSAMPLAGAAWLYAKATRMHGAVLTTNLLRLGSLVTGLVGIAWIVLLAAGQAHAWPVWAISATCGAIFAVVAAATVRVVNTRTAAIFVDQQVGLRERVSTALEIIHVAPATQLEASFHKPIVDSALMACATVRTAKVGYARLDRRAYALALCTLLAASGVSLLTPLPASAKPNRPQYVKVEKVVDKLAEKIAELEKKQLANGDEEAKKALSELKAAVEKTRKENMSIAEAASTLAEAKDAMQNKLDQMAASEKVEQTLEAAKNDNLEKIAKAAQELANAEQNAKTGAPGGAEQKSAAEEQLKAEAQALAEKLAAGKMTEAEKNKLASDLKKAAEQAKDDPQLQSSLERAAEAAQKGDAKSMASNMNDAGQRMGQQQAQQKLTGGALKEGMQMADAGMEGLSSDEDKARQQREQQANSGNQGGEQEGNQGGQQGGENGGQQGGQQSANAGGEQGGQQGGQQGGNQGGDQGGDQGGQEGGDSGGQQAGGQGGQKPGQGSNQPGSGGGQQIAGSSGSTNFRDPGSAGPSNENPKEIGKQGTFVKIYDSVDTKSAGKNEKAMSVINSHNPSKGSMDIKTLADKKDPTIVTYESQRADAKAKAMDDLQKQDLPPQYRDLVRDFFEK